MKHTYYFADDASAVNYRRALSLSAGIRKRVQVVIIIGPSGSGKTTLGRELIAAAGGTDEAVKMITPMPEDRNSFTAQAVAFLKAGFVHFDNVSRLRKGVRNALIELARGGAFTWTPTGGKVPLSILTPRCFVVINGHDGNWIAPELERVALVIRLAQSVAAWAAFHSGRPFHDPVAWAEHLEELKKKWRSEQGPLRAIPGIPVRMLDELDPWPAVPAPAPGVIPIQISPEGDVITNAGMTHAAAKALLKWSKAQEKELRPAPVINASVDIETWGTAARSAVSAIGAVKFNALGVIVGRPFYMRIDIKSCIAAGLTLDADTMVWWMGQDDEARREVCKAGASLRCVLEAFAWWLCDGNGKEINVWGNGWDFDGGRLGDAYAATGIRLPWDYWHGRDLRTLEAEFPSVKDEAEGVAHNALDDAIGQAKKITRIWAEKEKLQHPMMEVKS
ncbi:MAG: Exodeoxyribonuclease [Rariglobus sp.]|jgi:hypothetical protein|nr:Exodeoxyribonuclease [Rariglobus sp.]